MKSPLAVRRQLAVVERLIARKAPPWVTTYDNAHMKGMQQALAWVLGENAASPRKCLPRRPRKATTAAALREKRLAATRAAMDAGYPFAFAHRNAPSKTKRVRR